MYKMSNKSCQTNFIKYVETTPLVDAVIVDVKTDTDTDEECDLGDCCCMCLWYLFLGGVVGGVMYYTGAFV